MKNDEKSLDKRTKAARSTGSFYIALIDLPQIPIFAGADSFHLFEDPAEVRRFSYPAGKSDFFDFLVGKAKHLFSVSDPHHLQVRHQCHPVLLLEQSSQIMLIDKKVVSYCF